jgi:ATP-dependent protease ClpP protease subunit
MKPTAEMADEGRQGLAWRAEYNRGGTAIGVARARDISNRANLSPDTIRRMVSYFARHEVDKEAQGFKPGEEGYPSAGRIAWALWGGDPGKAWANQQSKQLENMITIENKAAKVKLNDHVDKFSVDKVIEEISKVYGMTAVKNNYAFGEIVACAENAVDTLEIEIHTSGGSVFEGGRIYNELKSLRERGVYVTARINTLAASMGSVIAMGADKVVIASNGKIMIHEASGGMQGDSEDLARYAALLEEISDDIAEIYSEKTGMEKYKIRKMMKSETWMSAKQAVEMGFADEIFDTKRNVMSILDKFRPDAALVEKVTGLEAILADTENQVTEISAQLFEARNDLATAINELTEAKTQVAEFESNINTISAERDNAARELTASKEKITELESAIITAQESANTMALEIAAKAGLAPLAVDPNESESTNTKTRKEFNQLNAKQKSDFCKNGGKII